ncbi:MAG TPA: S8 family serine peptidase [Thermoanaerobaculia bacterium]|nr:S8 family serine peptidase [Thermoanaerobaculia bacterium]
MRTARSFVFSLLLLLPALPTFAGTGRILRAVKPVANQYIVVLNAATPADAVASIATRLTHAHGGRIVTTYTVLFRGFCVAMPDAAATALARDPEVASIEEDAYGQLATTQTMPVTYPPPSGTPMAASLASFWHLDRLDQASSTAPRLNGSYAYCTTGSGVRAYIVDTGVLPTHPEFGGRVDTAPDLANYLNAAGLGLGPQCWTSAGGSQFYALAGHGTGVASIVGGATAGVAKGVTIVDARAVECSSPVNQTTTSRINKVLEWIPQDPNRGTKSVVNMSLSYIYTMDPAYGGTGQTSMAQAVTTLVDTYHIPVVAAAGNENLNVFWYIPGDIARAITVAGSYIDSTGVEAKWPYSNWGNTTAFYAPAQYIESASTLQYIDPSRPWRSQYPECTSDYPDDTCVSGTSFAAPIVTGVVARYLETHAPGATREQIVSALQANAKAYIVDPGLGNVPLINMADCP